MWSLLKAALVLAVLAAALFLAPIRGRTLADRWRAADGAVDFARRGWAELRGAPPPRVQPRPGTRAQGRAGERGGEPGADATPAEAHSEADRRALDKLLGEHLADAPKR
jgi:hypothetical protein